MRVTVIIAMYLRHDLTRLCFSHLKCQQNKYGFNVVIAGSELLKSRDLVKEFGFVYIETPNSPLSEKHNLMIRAAKDLDSELVVLLGSDDFVNDEYFDTVYKLDSKPPVIYGYNQIYFYTSRDNQLSRFDGYQGFKTKIIGAGRIYTKSALKKLHYNPWNKNLDRGLDTDSANKSLKFGVEEVLLENDVFILDVKHSHNITSPLIAKSGEKVSLSIMKKLGLKTYESIKNLKYVSGNDTIKRENDKFNIMDKIDITIIKDKAGMKVGEERTVEKFIGRSLINRGIAKLTEPEKLDTEKTLSELREKYPDVKAKSKKKFLNELKNLENNGDTSTE